MSRLQGDCVLLGLWLCRRVNGGEDGVSQVIWSRRRLDTRRGFGLGGCTINIPDGFGECAANTPRAWRTCRKHRTGKFGGVLKTATQAGFPAFQKPGATEIPRRHVAASGRLRRVEANDRPLTTIGSDLYVSSLFWPLRAF